MMVSKLNLLKIEEKGKELKVPYHTSTTVVYNGNLPHIKATYLI